VVEKISEQNMWGKGENERVRWFISRFLTGVGIAPYNVGLRAELPGFDSAQKKVFIFSIASRPVLGPTQPPIHWGASALYPGLKRPGRDADNSSAPGAVVKIYGAISPLPNMSSWRSA
jgi:hypothetical protein